LISTLWLEVATDVAGNVICYGVPAFPESVTNGKSNLHVNKSSIFVTYLLIHFIPN
jgi:hypothetical protein